MIQIAFCDDDQTVLDQLSALLEKYRAQRCVQIQCTAFHSPLDLLAEIEKGTRYDILFLDVIMPAENGITAAKEIRQYDNVVKIIFLTSSAEFAVESYVVGAYFYQLKPIWEDSFFRLTDSVIAECRRADQRSLILRCKTGITRVELDKLEYCEVIRRSLLLHKTDGTVLEAAGSMDSLCESLAEHRNFLRIHRSYLVNLEHIQTITPKRSSCPAAPSCPFRADASTTSRTRTLNTPSRRAGVPDMIALAVDLCNSVAVTLFGIALSAAFCNIHWTPKAKKRMLLYTLMIFFLSGIAYLGVDRALDAICIRCTPTCRLYSRCARSVANACGR